MDENIEFWLGYRKNAFLLNTVMEKIKRKWGVVQWPLRYVFGRAGRGKSYFALEEIKERLMETG